MPAPVADPYLRAYLRDACAQPLLSRAEELALAKRAERGDEEAQAILVERNRRLVFKTAGYYLGRGLDRDDLIAEGQAGLFKAAQKFRTRFRCRFSTYAVWWIKQAIRQALRVQPPVGRPCRVPAYVLDSLSAWGQARERLAQRLGRVPTEAETKLRVPLKHQRLAARNRQAIRALRPAVSLTHEECPPGSDGINPRGEAFADYRTEDPLDAAIRAETAEMVRGWLRFLPPKYALILTLRFGLDGKGLRTLDEIGKLLGRTRERIRQMQAKALAKLRELMGREW